jgi:hypothetical protein
VTNPKLLLAFLPLFGVREGSDHANLLTVKEKLTENAQITGLMRPFRQEK